MSVLTSLIMSGFLVCTPPPSAPVDDSLLEQANRLRHVDDTDDASATDARSMLDQADLEREAGAEGEASSTQADTNHERRRLRQDRMRQPRGPDRP